MKVLVLVFFIAFGLFSTTYSQVQINKPIQLSGTGSDAKVEGIKNVSGAQDAVSVESHQKGGLIFSSATGSGNNFVITLSPAVDIYQTGMVINFKSNQSITGSATIDVNGLGQKSIRKNLSDQLVGCDIVNGQMVTVIYDGTNFQMTSPTYVGGVVTANAGPDQLNINGLSATLAATNPSPASGSWSIISGAGGSFANTSQYNTTFTGTDNTTYVLRWTVSTACSSTFDEVTISFHLIIKRIFLTSQFYTGNLGGLSGADSKCQTLANGKSLGGTWKAWISSSTVSAASRLSQNAGPYKLLNGNLIANSWADLTDGTIASCICYDENQQRNSNAAWTNTTSSGGIKSTTNTCSDWTSTSGSGQFGDPDQTDFYWTDSSTLPCNNSGTLRLYCFEQ